MFTEESIASFDKRKARGETMLRVSWGRKVEGDDDRWSAAADAISDILTATCGRAGRWEPALGTDGEHLVFDEDAIQKANDLLDRAYRSYRGDAEDYSTE